MRYLSLLMRRWHRLNIVVLKHFGAYFVPMSPKTTANGNLELVKVGGGGFATMFMEAGAPCMYHMFFYAENSFGNIRSEGPLKFTKKNMRDFKGRQDPDSPIDTIFDHPFFWLDGIQGATKRCRLHLG